MLLLLNKGDGFKTPVTCLGIFTSQLGEVALIRDISPFNLETLSSKFNFATSLFNDALPVDFCGTILKLEMV